MTVCVFAPSRPVNVYAAGPEVPGRVTFAVAVPSRPTAMVRLPEMPGPLRQNRSPTRAPVATSETDEPGSVPDEVTARALAEPRTCVRPETACTDVRHQVGRSSSLIPEPCACVKIEVE